MNSKYEFAVNERKITNLIDIDEVGGFTEFLLRKYDEEPKLNILITKMDIDINKRLE